MPLQATSGAASYDAFGGGVPSEPNYIESVFSCFLYTGNDSTQTITNGIDLAGEGGMVWIKARNTGSTFNCLFDTARGATKALFSNATNAQGTYADTLTSFNTTGFTLGADTTTNFVNSPTGQTEVSWTFRKQPKFFDVVTFTGDGTSSRAIAHSLTSTPGCIIVKRTDNTGAWYVYHRGVDPTLAYAYFMVLNTTAARAGAPAVWDVAPTSTNFTVQPDTTNISGATYVAYLFASNAGGFGLTGTDNVISCSNFITDSTGGATVTLGYEPQWILVKQADAAANWYLFDVMRGMNVTTNASLNPNTSDAETSFGWAVKPTATGFDVNPGRITSAAGQTFIYIAIRRGPMKVPTSGTSVYNASVPSSTSAGQVLTSGFPDDLIFQKYRTLTTSFNVADRLRGIGVLSTANTNAENTGQDRYQFDVQDGVELVIGDGAYSMLYYHFRRAPSFFDEVCYTGTGSYMNVNHNLGVIPELVIRKDRNQANGWDTSANINPSNETVLALNTTDSGYVSAYPFILGSYPTSTVINIGSQSAITYVVYLFASCPGVSKVGSYTGTGATQTINCGFTGGARFVMIKRTDSTGSWYVWDVARGIVSGNDPYLLLNSTAAEVTITDYIDTYSAGFELSTTAAATVNVLNGTYIYLAIA